MSRTKLSQPEDAALADDQATTAAVTRFFPKRDAVPTRPHPLG
jgi:hypothetical protein